MSVFALSRLQHLDSLVSPLSPPLFAFFSFLPVLNLPESHCPVFMFCWNCYLLRENVEHVYHVKPFKDKVLGTDGEPLLARFCGASGRPPLAVRKAPHQLNSQEAPVWCAGFSPPGLSPAFYSEEWDSDMETLCSEHLQPPPQQHLQHPC